MSENPDYSPASMIVEMVERSVQTHAPVFSKFDKSDCFRESVEFVAKSNVYFELWGGYPYAEMRILGIDSTHSKTETSASIVRDGSLNPTLGFPIAAVQVRASNPGTRIALHSLVHDLLSLNINRGQIGDVIESPEGLVVFTLEDSADYLRDALSRTSKIPIITKLSDANLWKTFSPEQESVTVASNRLDAVVSALFRLSREDGRDAVRNEMVKINDKPILKAAAAAKINDIIDLETRGRARICVYEETSKGRIRISFVRYRRISPSV